MLILKKLTQSDPCITELSEINNNAFPEYERMEMSEMFSLTSDTEVIGFFETDTPVGFSMLVKGNACAYMYYLAIGEKYRGKGYGSAALRLLLNKYSGIQITLDFEELLPNAGNYSQRKRRKKFYLSNGFHETGRYTFLSGNRFEVVCSEKELNAEGLTDIIREIHKSVPEFAEELA